MKKTLLSLLLIAFCVMANAKGIYKFALDEKLTFEEAKASASGVAIVHNGRVLCKSGNELLMVALNDIDATIAWQATFEASNVEGSNYIGIGGQYINASVWSHTYPSGKNDINGEKENGMLWTIAAAGESSYTIRNLGVEQGYYDNSINNNGVQSDKGWLCDMTGGYWANHATWQNNAGDEWEFYTLKSEKTADTSWTWTKVTLAEAVASSDPVVFVQNDVVLCNSNGGANFASKADFDSYAFWVKLEADNADNNQYFIQLCKESGEAVNYLNSSVWSHVFLGGIDKNGTKGEKQDGAVFTIAEIGESQYSIRSLGAVEGSYGEEHTDKGYVTFQTGGYWANNATWQNAAPSTWEFYVLTDKQIVPVDPNQRIFFTAEEANVLDITKATNYDAESAKFTANGAIEFTAPQDFGDWKWLVVVTSANASSAGGEFRVKDANGNSIGGEDYNKGGGTSRGNMWLDRWNNQVCATVNMEYIMDKGIDITKISSISFTGGQPVSAVYLTNYEAGQAVKNTQSWGSCTGDYVREYATLPEGGKFGTIALKYAAAVSGAQVFTLDEYDEETGVFTLARHYNVLEAGVPYFYLANDEGGKNVNFFRVDANAVTDDWSNNNARDNGLIGYYDNGFWPGSNAILGNYILSNNEMHLIDGGDITLGTNRCFFDPTKYQGPKNSTNAKIRINGTEAPNATAIQNVQFNNLKSADKIYDINGREVKTMTKGGIYVVGGMKVYIK